MEVVYFVQCETTKRIKIGYSAAFHNRFWALKKVCSTPLRLVALIPGTIKLEKALHRMFHYERDHSEWSRLTPRFSHIINLLRAEEGRTVVSEFVETKPLIEEYDFDWSRIDIFETAFEGDLTEALLDDENDDDEEEEEEEEEEN